MPLLFLLVILLAYVSVRGKYFPGFDPDDWLIVIPGNCGYFLGYFLNCDPSIGLVGVRGGSFSGCFCDCDPSIGLVGIRGSSFLSCFSNCDLGIRLIGDPSIVVSFLVLDLEVVLDV